MDERDSAAASLGLVAVGATLSLLLYARLPDQMAVHWSASGRPDGYVGKQVGAFAVPAAALAVAGVLALAPRVEPLGENVEPLREQYNAFVVATTGFLLSVHLLVLAANLAPGLPVTLTVAPAVGALLYAVGILLEHAPPNRLVGVRTPWTLAGDEVWNRTHALAARLFRGAGVLTALAGLAGEYAVYLLVGPAVVASLVAMAYSYYVYRRLDAEPDVAGAD